MRRFEISYCNSCEDLVGFTIHSELVTEIYRGREITYPFEIGRCKCCGTEVATDIDYNSRKSEAKIKAYEENENKLSPKL